MATLVFTVLGKKLFLANIWRENRDKPNVKNLNHPLDENKNITRFQEP